MSKETFKDLAQQAAKCGVSKDEAERATEKLRESTLHIPDPAAWSTDYDRLIELMEQGKRVVTVWTDRYGERMGQALCHSVGHRSSWEVCDFRCLRKDVIGVCEMHNLQFLDTYNTEKE